jgi:hypothetical protein
VALRPLLFRVVFMTSISGRPVPRRSGRRKPVFNQRLQAQSSSILVSLAGLIGRSVYDRRGNRVGRVHDLIVALGKGGEHPPLHSILVRTAPTSASAHCSAASGLAG